jgi:hypothetical protein
MPATDASADMADIVEGHFVLILDNPRGMSAALDVLRAQSAHRPHQKYTGRRRSAYGSGTSLTRPLVPVDASFRSGRGEDERPLRMQLAAHVSRQ